MNCSVLRNSIFVQRDLGPSTKGHAARGEQCGAAGGGSTGALCWHLSSNVTVGEEGTPDPCRYAQQSANMQTKDQAPGRSKAGKGIFLALSESKAPSSLDLPPTRSINRLSVSTPQGQAKGHGSFPSKLRMCSVKGEMLPWTCLTVGLKDLKV